MGENLAIHWPGETSKVWKGLPEGRPIRPRIDDIAALRERLPELRRDLGRDAQRPHRHDLRTQDRQRPLSGVSWNYGDPASTSRGRAAVS